MESDGLPTTSKWRVEELTGAVNSADNFLSSSSFMVLTLHHDSDGLLCAIRFVHKLYMYIHIAKTVIDRGYPDATLSALTCSSEIFPKVFATAHVTIHRK